MYEKDNEKIDTFTLALKFREEETCMLRITKEMDYLEEIRVSILNELMKKGVV